MFIAIATMLHVLVFKRTRVEGGKVIIVDPETAKYTTGLTRYVNTTAIRRRLNVAVIRRPFCATLNLPLSALGS